MIRRGLVLLVVASLAACASDPPPRPRLVARPVPAPVPEPAAPTPSELAAQAAALTHHAAPSPLDTVVATLGVEKAELVWSPTRKSFAVVVPPKVAAAEAPVRMKTKRPPPATIAVYAPGGERLGSYRALAVGTVGELRFLGEDRLMYQLPAKSTASAGGRAHGAASLPPALRYAIQPLKANAPPIACTGRQFVFSPTGDHVAHLAGDARRQRLFADGQPVYPRRGWTTIQGEPAWSQDGVSLALIESGPHRRLVVLVEYDNPSGDNTWPLPPEASDPSLQVYWAGLGQLVVGPSLTKPLFAASYHRDPTPVVSMPVEAVAAPGPGRP